MNKYIDVIIDTAGNAVSGASIHVTAYPSGVPVLIYTSDGSGLIAGSVVTTDSTGGFSFYALNGRYTFDISVGGVPVATINDVDIGDPTLIADLASTATGKGAALSGYLSPASGAVATNVSAYLNLMVKGLKKTFGAVGDDVANDRTAIVNAFASGKIIEAEDGIFLFPTTIVIPNGLKLYGFGQTQTTFKYSGTSDAFQINNPINSSTAANIELQNFYIQSVTRTAGKAGLADVGSTFLNLRHVRFFGNDYSLILDQSELVNVDECDFELGATATAGVWLVNGAEHTGGASTFYTNRISIHHSQFNGGTVGAGIADDGGLVHTFENNNFNAMAKHIRSTAVKGLRICGNEFEVPVTTCLDFQLTKVGGAGSTLCTVVDIKDNLFFSDAAIGLINLGAVSCINALNVESNHFNNSHAGGTPFSGSVSTGANTYTGKNNYQEGIGGTALGNTYNVTTAYTPAWTSDGGTQPALGNGSITGSYIRNGNSCTARITLAIGTSTTFGNGNFRFGLPFTSTDAKPVVGSWYGSPAGTLRAGSSVTFNTNYALINVDNVGFIGGASFSWASPDTVNITITYPISIQS